MLEISWFWFGVSLLAAFVLGQILPRPREGFEKYFSNTIPGLDDASREPYDPANYD